MLALELDCDGGARAWGATESGPGTGSMELERLTGLQHPACPFQRPELRELYDINITKVPVPVPDITPGQPRLTCQADALAEDGKVAGFDTLKRGWLAHPGGSSVEHRRGEILIHNPMVLTYDAD